MQNKVSALILSDDIQTQKLLKMCLDEFEHLEYIEFSEDYQILYDKLLLLDSSILLVDFSNFTDSKLDFVLKVTNNIAGCKVLALSDDPSVDLIVKVMRAGAIEFVALPLIKSEFLQAFSKLKEAFASQPKTFSKCKIISVFSNKGGIGKTSIVSNLALEIAKITKEKVALIDLNFQLGDVTTFMDLNPSFNISYLLQNLDKLNEDFLLSTLERYNNTDLYVLADPPYFKQADDISPKQILKLFNILKETFSYIIIDAESSFDSKNMVALTESDMIFLVTVANLPALRNTQRCLELFDRLGFDSAKPQVILNRYMENDEVSISDVETVINKKLYWKIPNNYFTMMSAINKGIPVSDLNPSSNVGKSYKDLAIKITDNIYRENIVKKHETLLK